MSTFDGRPLGGSTGPDDPAVDDWDVQFAISLGLTSLRVALREIVQAMRLLRCAPSVEMNRLGRAANAVADVANGLMGPSLRDVE
ncbi:MAG: hypothetical protein JWN46_77 [Acidimicrobiales bacterium]|nr:hypothetical protein [Acidimicrobiales bacterium]